MFYVSSLKYSIQGYKLWGITDTDDNVEEFYTEHEIIEIFKKIGYTSIKGATHTGSSIKFERLTLAIISIMDLSKDSSFKLNINGKVHEFIMIGQLASGDGWSVKEGSDIKKLTKRWLYENRLSVSFI